jgi:hypothetical protein
MKGGNEIKLRDEERKEIKTTNNEGTKEIIPRLNSSGHPLE